MEERYEFRGKIGQGGLGAVYRAHDIRMNREVAIKRIEPLGDDESLPAEATRQLIKEAGSLASLQHPNIVTIYDVGEDADGPFVVMELLEGETLEVLIGEGSFTWQDFRQLAMQALEALIAAQELHLVHRDLKPSNIMLTWLPSGKFQVKIVDFGLAKLSAKPSLQTIDQSDGVFGSIYFMAPEQFERVPIDQRTDLYAIACVFYYALTGSYPFDGDTAAGVMGAHLQHHVTPIQEVREGIPMWACEWIMWHLNRQPLDRPETARESLQIFLENDASQEEMQMSTGTATPIVVEPKRPKLLIPGAAPVPEVINEDPSAQPRKTATVPKPLAPPQGSKPSLHTSTQSTHSGDEESGVSLEGGEANQSASSHTESRMKFRQSQIDEVAPKKSTATNYVSAAPRPNSGSANTGQLKNGAASITNRGNSHATQPNNGTRPIVPALVTGTPTGPMALSKTGPIKASIATSPLGRKTGQLGGLKTQQKKKGISKGGQIAIAGGIGLLVILMSFLFIRKSGSNAENKMFSRIVSQAKMDRVEPIAVTSSELEMLLRNAASVGANKQRGSIYMALSLAEAVDGTDVDGRIAEFATTEVLVPDIRTVLIRDVRKKTQQSRGDRDFA